MITLFSFLVIDRDHHLRPRAGPLPGGQGRSGIRVERFSLGYPPRMSGGRYGDTDYCISWLPARRLREDVRHDRREPGGKEKITGAPDEFMSKKPWQKILVITAGVIMNFVLAAAIYSTVTLVKGVPRGRRIRWWRTISPGFPAEKAGIDAGDQHHRGGWQGVPTWDELVAIIHASPDKPLLVSWEHEGEAHEAEIIPQREKTLIKRDIKEVGLIGILPAPTFRPAGFVESFGPGRA